MILILDFISKISNKIHFYNKLIFLIIYKQNKRTSNLCNEFKIVLLLHKNLAAMLFPYKTIQSNIYTQVDSKQHQYRKITCLPLQFEYLPVQILSKEFTKLNNPHSFRIHYLGPRFKNTIQLHKKNAYNQKKPFVYNPDVFGNFVNKKVESEKNIIENQWINDSQAQIAIKNQYIQEQERQVSQMSPRKVSSKVEKYKVDMHKIVHSFLLEQKLKNTQYFKSTVYYRAFQGMNPSLNVQNQFVFNSCFQNGNLDCVIKLQERQFDLFLRIDSNTRGHLLWFYFSVKNQNQLGKIKMNICNFSKSKNLYKEGLKPYIFSTKKYQFQNKSWQQNGTNLGLQKKQLRYQILQNKHNNNNVNCLTLEYDFQYEYDQVFFAYCIPYTYSQLLNDIDQLSEKYVEKNILGKSLLGTYIPILHITQNPKIKEEQCQNKGKKSQYQSTTSNLNSDKQMIDKIIPKTPNKKVIFVTGRIHPSQSNSSYVLMGFIKWLCSQQKQAIQIRKIARFIIVPMVNPDGVIIGNSRTSASGKDLNRQYINPDPSLHPQICMIKQFARKVHQQYPITLFLDFHGHSRKKNTFFYGPVYSISQPNYYKCRILPKLIQKIANPFRYHSCSFNIIQDKKKTARASMFQSLGIEYTYTVQSSIGYFYDCQKLKLFEFSQQQWRKMGKAIAHGTANFLIGLDSYEQILQERKKQRLRKKRLYRIPQPKIQYLEDQFYLQVENGEQPLKIPYEDKDGSIQPKNSNTDKYKSKKSSKNNNFFLEMLQQLRTTTKTQKVTQIKQNGQEVKDIDLDQDSDSHDDKQDMQINRLNQFKQLVKHIKTDASTINKQKNGNQTRFSSKDNQNRSKRNLSVNKKSNINEFQLLNQFQKSKNTPIRIIKTGDGRRHHSPNKLQFHLVQQSNHRQKTQPQYDQNEKQLDLFNLFKNKHQAPSFFNSMKRQLYTSGKKIRRNLQSASKKERTSSSGNYFGQYKLLINDSQKESQKKFQKADLIRKLQSRRQNARKKRAQSSNQLTSNLQLSSTPHNMSFNFQPKKQKIEQLKVHGPTQFMFSLPFGQLPNSSKSAGLKPKIKPHHIRQKPNSLQNIQQSISIKQRQSSIDIKQQSQKTMNTLYHMQIKQSARDKKVSQSYLIQHSQGIGTPLFSKKVVVADKNSARQGSSKCTKIDLGDANNVSVFNNLKIRNM